MENYRQHSAARENLHERLKLDELLSCKIAKLLPCHILRPRTMCYERITKPDVTLLYIVRTSVVNTNIFYHNSLFFFRRREDLGYRF